MKKQNVFIATFYTFIPLKGKPKGQYMSLFENSHKDVKPLRLIKYMEAKYSYAKLINDDGTFVFEYNDSGRKIKRRVTMRFWLVNFSSAINLRGRYYLVATIGIDKAFDNNNTAITTFGVENYCTAKDLVHLKRSLYGHDNSLYYIDNGIKRTVLWRLDQLIEIITGNNPQGHYGRHYIIDVCGVDLNQGKSCLCLWRRNNINSQASLTEAFSKLYYSKKAKRFSDVIENHGQLIYGLIYGNENNKVVPQEAQESELNNNFFNNISECLFAGCKTEIFLQTHHPSPWNKEDVGAKIKLDDNPLKRQIVFDIFIVLEAKLRLKRIKETLKQGNAADIKDALASISSYLNTNPYHLGEYHKRILMLYKNLGVTELYNSVKEQGNLLADAKKIEMDERLHSRVYNLTCITVLIGIFSLVVSILCCNNCNINPNQITNMSECLILCIVGVWVCLILAASIIATGIYQYRSFCKLKEIVHLLKKQEK